MSANGATKTNLIKAVLRQYPEKKDTELKKLTKQELFKILRS